MSRAVVGLKPDFVPVLAEGLKPDFSTVIPNLALKTAISNWCKSTEADLPSDAPDYSSIKDSVRKLMSNSSQGEGDSRFRDSEKDLLKGVAEKPPVILAHAATQLNPRSVHHRFYSSSSEESVIANIPDTPPLLLVTRPLFYSSSPSASTSSEIVTDETLDPNPNSSTSDEQNFSTKLQCLDVFEQELSVVVVLVVDGGGGSAKGYDKDDFPNVLHYPLNSQTYNIVTDFLFKERKLEMSITHNSHVEHPLTLVDTRCNDITSPMKNKVVEDLCNGCLTPIMENMRFYKCTYGCDYVLHDWCTRLPTKVKGHQYNHPEHTLILVPKLPPSSIGLFRCYVCKMNCNGFAYSCVKCDDCYIDVCCALTGKGIRHKSHPHHLLIRTQIRPRDKNYCRVCLSGFYHKETLFSCYRCKFHLHTGCALLLPKTIRHKYDKHPMTISYSPVENHEGDYFCEVCEEEINPNACFYHCQKCVQSIHLACAPLIPQIKAYIYKCLSEKGVSYHENIKLGSIHKIEDHPHTLTLLKATPTDDADCTNCHDTLNESLILRCLQCKFTVHSYHYYDW
ncbi:hypothetical protein L1987_70374 [Smallanthus sonchifolius]|uniref:Uncharacterized protein n=1 Tax=Smallanthus sonchifolius TaxID=185202 RepID=A0ACB9AQ02_9ASTR|nr:hypothetical protein L1987_70374 [Smallanthus sonchifolius]